MNGGAHQAMMPAPASAAAHLRSLWQNAHAHAERREWEQAKACFNAILARRPDDPAVLVELSYVCSLQGQYRAARAALMRAWSLPPGSIPAPVLGQVVSRLRTFNEAVALHDLLDRLGDPRTLPLPLLLACAAQLSYFNEQERALLLLDEAKRADPDHPPTLAARGQVLVYLSRFDEAERDLLHCLSRSPGMAQAHFLLSRIPARADGGKRADAMRNLLQRQALRPGDEAMLAFALHHELDRLDDHAGAWTALVRACRAKRSMLDYGNHQAASLVDALIAFDAAVPAGIPPGMHAGGRVRIPVFILGMHRSGTTLLEQLLDGHDDIRGLGELYDFTGQMRHATDHHCHGPLDAAIVARAGGLDFAEVGRGYLQKMEWRLGKERHFTDKLPSNFLNIGFICRALPQARILHMVRDPVETCFSNLRELFSEANPYSNDQLELAAFYRQYRRLMAHWHQAWPGRILDVDYAELTRDPETVLRRACGFCGLDFQPAMLASTGRRRGIATASAVQVRQAIQVRRQPKWMPYEPYLQPLIQALAAP